jgi:hypothetical protein
VTTDDDIATQNAATAAALSVDVARYLAGAEPLPDDVDSPGIVVRLTPGQAWTWLLNHEADQRLALLGRLLDAADRDAVCHMQDHAGRLEVVCDDWTEVISTGDYVRCALPNAYPHTEHWHPSGRTWTAEQSGTRLRPTALVEVRLVSGPGGQPSRLELVWPDDAVRRALIDRSVVESLVADASALSTLRRILR